MQKVIKTILPVAQQVHEANSDASVHVEDKIRLLGGRNLLDLCVSTCNQMHQKFKRYQELRVEKAT